MIRKIMCRIETFLWNSYMGEKYGHITYEESLKNFDEDPLNKLFKHGVSIGLFFFFLGIIMMIIGGIS